MLYSKVTKGIQAGTHPASDRCEPRVGELLVPYYRQLLPAWASISGCFGKLGVLSMGVLLIRALLLGSR